MEKVNPIQNNHPNSTNKYKEGETVYPRNKPNMKLTIRRYVRRIYYCVDDSRTNGNDLVFFFEMELMGETERV